MEELPEIPPLGSFEIPGSQNPVPDQPAEELPEQQSNTAPQEIEAQSLTPTEAMTYELDISPGIKATVEIEQMAEADFDRHEVLNETIMHEPVRSGMIPLSQVLEQHPVMQNQANGVFGNDIHPGSVKKFLARPLYHQALVRGVGVGLIVSVVFAIALIIINR